MKWKLTFSTCLLGCNLLMAQDTITAPLAPLVLPGRGLSQHNFFYAGEQKNREMYIIRQGKIDWMYRDTAGRGEISDAVLMSDGNIVFAHQHGVTVITKGKKVLWNYTCTQGSEIHTAQPIGKQHIVFIENSDTARVKVVNIRSGKVVKEFVLPVQNAANPHGQFRHARLTSKGTYLVAHMDMNRIVEYNFDGRPLFQTNFPSPWSAIELSNGNILACSNKNVVREITKSGKTVWALEPPDLPDYRFFGMQTAYRLPNGNTVVNNWFNQWKRYKIDSSNMPVQFVEVSPEKKVVWALRSWEKPVNLGPSTIIQFLDRTSRAEDVHFGPIH